MITYNSWFQEVIPCLGFQMADNKKDCCSIHVRLAKWLYLFLSGWRVLGIWIELRLVHPLQPWKMTSVTLLCCIADQQKEKHPKHLVTCLVCLKYKQYKTILTTSDGWLRICWRMEFCAIGMDFLSLIRSLVKNLAIFLPETFDYKLNFVKLV